MHEFILIIKLTYDVVEGGWTIQATICELVNHVCVCPEVGNMKFSMLLKILCNIVYIIAIYQVVRKLFV